MDGSAQQGVGFIGLGRMGFPMAARLSSTVPAMAVYNRTRTVAEEFANHYGAAVAATPADLARQSSIVLSMAESAAASRMIFFSENGVIEGAASDCLVVEMATVSPDDAKEFASRFKRQGVAFLDAPVSGSVDSAQRGELGVMVGGPESDFSRAEPLLRSFAKTVALMGDVGSGALSKLGINLVLYALAVGIAEALALVRSSGADVERFYSALQRSATGAPLMEYRRAVFLDPDCEAARFPLRLVERDLGLIVDAARGVGRDLRQAGLDLEIAVEAVQQGYGEEDLAALTKMIAPANPAEQLNPGSRQPRETE
jgi:3-hydroxyisobutyrate dehydrogenase-like beta-hydroxyacid dehydrogenase